MTEINICDMCGTKIENGRYSCGYWVHADEMKDNPIKSSLEMFHELKQFTLTCDMAHLGCAAVFFRGDYNDTKKVEHFIKTMKGRPYYES